MAVRFETAEEVKARGERAMALAQQIIKDSWLDEGVTEEEWERGQMAGDVFRRLTGQGMSESEANAYLDAATWDEIQRKHQELFPRRYETK